MLFFINFRKESNLFKKLKNNKSVQLTIKKLSKLIQIYKTITKIKKKCTYY